ncbi:response regulator [Magnetovirga frankeli]|uniref:hybrid sensor histidine kinase/response regulator n=1 Tax=Magnetovirga frankeli TaxID=947516 RepID=UPI001293BA18|nr:response regulator [gamma proteobacterium SS-5]
MTGDREPLLEEVASEDAELLGIFLEEAQELGEEMDRALQSWQQNPQDKTALEPLKRVLHTLKGGARLAGVMQMGDLSHAYESLFMAIIQGNIGVTEPVLTLTRRVADHLLAQIESLAECGKLPSSGPLLQALERAQQGDWSASETLPAPTRAAPAKAPASAPSGPAAKSAPVPTAVPGPSAAPRAHNRPSSKTLSKQEMVRVRADRLDQMINNSGEISIFRARIEQQSGQIGFNLEELEQTALRLRGQLRRLELETEAQIQFRYERAREEGASMSDAFDPLEMDRFTTMQQIARGIAETVDDLVNVNEAINDANRVSESLLLQQSRVNNDLQDALLRTRMVSFSQVVPRLQRLVRQTAQTLGKQAELVVSGAGGDVDRSILDRIVAPLEHILRNACSHGIEEPAQRQAAGKNERGRIQMSLLREGKDMLIRVQDDGAGVNLKAVRKKALDRGLMTEQMELSDDELIQFLLEPGFSTASQVTQISGRGVGMDVVVSEVKQLGGVLDIRSKSGQGTRFDIRLPSTLSLTETLLVAVGEDTFAVPHTSVEGVIRMPREQLKACYDGLQEGVEYAGRIYRVRYLADMLGFVDPLGDFFPEQRKWYPMLLVRHGEQRVAIQVDRMLGSRQIVVKTVGPQLATVRWITGGTILADGRVALILDVSTLVRLSSRSGSQFKVLKHGELPDVSFDEPVPAAPEKKDEPLVMVVDDSITVRKVTSRLLSRHAMRVVTAKDGVDAVALLQEALPDIFLLDIEMPRMDGYELTRHLRHAEEYRDIPIIMITSRSGDKHRQHAMDLGVNLYLGKPFQEAELMASIRKLLREKRNKVLLREHNNRGEKA